MSEINARQKSGNIALGGILTECNEFSINLMTIENFKRYEYFENKEILKLQSGVVGGMLSVLNDSTFNVSPTVFASCSPGGVIEDKCYIDIKTKILEGIKHTEQLKGVLLPLHGAAVTQSIGDLEGDLISSIREIIGSEVPIVVTLDLHAHVTKQMIENSSAILAWEQYPHLDPYETGVRGSKLLREILENNIRPKMFFSKTPILHSAINASTFGHTPFAELMKSLKHEERNNPKIISSSLIHVDPYIDQTNMGGGAIVITNNDIETAKTISLQFTKLYWDRRHEFEPVLYSPKEAILDGLGKNQNALLVETADACGGGAVGDSVHTLKALISFSPNENSLVHVVDPEAATKCIQSGIGNEV
ncbi:MAG: M81 family metallopeptidase, partial [Proteobacteria bacterium]|nr:M81 family metallopeptidase [Pseudomonadota bacterium]